MAWHVRWRGKGGFVATLLMTLLDLTLGQDESEAVNATPPETFNCNTSSCSRYDVWINQPYEGQFENETDRCLNAQMAALQSFGTKAAEECVRARLFQRPWEDCRKEYCQMYADIVEAISLAGGPFYFGGDECRPLLDFNQTLCETSYRDAEAFCDCYCPSIMHFEAEDSCKQEVMDFLLLGRRGLELAYRHRISRFCVINFCQHLETLGDIRQPLNLFDYGGVPPKCRELELPFKQASCNAWMTSNPFEPCPFLEDSGDGNVLECTDGFQCDIDIRNADSWSCCGAHDLRKHCPANWPVMCADPVGCNGKTDHCCETSTQNCADGKRRQCSPMMALQLPEWIGIVDEGVVVPAEAPPTTTLDPSVAALLSFSTTQGESLSEQVRGGIPAVLVVLGIIGGCCLSVAIVGICLTNGAKVQTQVYGVARIMGIWANEDAVVRFVPTGESPKGQKQEPLPDLPDPQEVQRKRRQEELIAKLAGAVKAAYGRASNHFVVDENSPAPKEEAPLREAIREVREAGLEYRMDTSDVIARGEAWLRTLEAEFKLVRCMADVRPDLRTAGQVWPEHGPQEGPWKATLRGAMASGQAKTARWSNVEKLTAVVKDAKADGASHRLLERALELRAELVGRTLELPSDRCVLDPEGEGVKILPVGSKRAVWPVTGEIYRYEEDLGAANDPDDMPDRTELGVCGVDPARPVCALYVEKRKCHLGRRCPWRHQLPQPGDSIRAVVSWVSTVRCDAMATSRVAGAGQPEHVGAGESFALSRDQPEHVGAPARKRPRPSNCARDESLAELSGLLDWLRAEGADLDGLYFGRDGRGGMGAFAARVFGPGDVLAVIPKHCVLTVGVAKESQLGVAAMAVAADLGCSDLCTDEVLLWLYMCVGRVEPSNPFHAYLAALPGTSPEPTCWPPELQEELRSTPIGAAMDLAMAQLQTCYDEYVSRLPHRLPHLIPPRCLESVQALLWARGMCFSRAYNAKALCQKAFERDSAATILRGISDHKDGLRTTGQVSTVLLPLFDLLNHRAGQLVKWTADECGVRVQTGDKLRRGDEVFNDYGSKSNEDLLFAHGFCLQDNPMDAVVVWLSRGGDVESGPRRTRYMVGRPTAGGVPTELWRALATKDSNKSADARTNSPGEVVVGVREVTILAQALRDMLRNGHLPKTQMEDDFRLRACLAGTLPADGLEAKKLFLAMYRQGQRDVIKETMASLAEMLERAMGDA